MDDQPVKIIAICGSLREKSYTRMALKVALQAAEELGAEVELIDLKDYNIPFCDATEDSYNAPDVKKISGKIMAAKGLILGSPEYHGSYTGVLKNMLDLLGFKEFQGKMIGLIGVAGGSMGAINALNGLRSIGRQLHAWVIPEQASIPRASSAFDENENFVDPRLEDRVKEVGRQVARFAFLHNSSEAKEFVKAWESAPMNPGGVKIN